MLKRIDIESTLDKIGMPRRTKGYNYIVEMILLIDDAKTRNTTLTEKYELVGEMYDVSWHLVERSIRYAFTTTRDNGDNFEEVEHYLGFINTQNLNTLIRLYNMINEDQSKYVNDYLMNLSKDKLKRLLFELVKDGSLESAFA